jgi:cell division protease FtsH
MGDQNDSNQDQQQQGSNKGPGQRPGRHQQGGGSGGQGGPGGPNNFMSRGALGWVLLVGLAVALFLVVSQAQNQAEEISWGEFKQLAQEGKFRTDPPIVVEEQKVVGTLEEGVAGTSAEEGQTDRRMVVIGQDLRPHIFEALQGMEGVKLQVQNSNNFLFHLLVTWGPFILIALLIYFFVFRAMRNAGGGPGGMLGNFGRSKHKMLTKEHSNVTMQDVAGVQEAKEEVNEIIEFLKNPKKFQRLGGRVPRGVLLVGAPGGGKTMLAKGVAGEADVPFFSISGSDFVEMFVGVGSSRVRDLFSKAKESAPCIIFLDEIDAIGRKRSGGMSSGGHDEREQTLNAILVEMDGFDSSDQVIVIAATNRADVLDPALTRPGRFDRQIQVPLPDVKGRLEILRVHAKKVKLSPDVDLEKVARGTPMFSGADLAAIINEAAIAATLQNKEFVEQTDLEEARDKVKWGRARKSHKVEEDEKSIVAYHEAGHAVIMHYDEHCEPLHKVSILPRGQGLGVTIPLPEKDRHLYTKKQLMSQLRMSFGGRIAEHKFCHDISSGAAQDIRQATQIAKAMVTEYGMSEKLGFLFYGNDGQAQPWEMEKAYSEETARMIDEEVKGLVDQTYGEAEEVIESHRQELHALAQALLKYETLNREEVEKVLGGEDLGRATVSELLDAERSKQPEPEESDATQPQSQREDLGDDTPGGAMPRPA